VRAATILYSRAVLQQISDRSCTTLLPRAVIFVFASTLLVGCSAKQNDLDTMNTTDLSISGHSFHVWLAVTPDQQERGLMQVPAEQLSPVPNPAGAGLPAVDRGMLFVFDNESPLSFWMYNTITPLDIAYISADGRIVKTYTMAPMETRTYPSIEPAMYALEVRAGLFAELGITAGQQVEIPQSVLKTQP
jgi:uncharacterized protein